MPKLSITSNLSILNKELTSKKYTLPPLLRVSTFWKKLFNSILKIESLLMMHSTTLCSANAETRKRNLELKVQQSYPLKKKTIWTLQFLKNISKKKSENTTPKKSEEIEKLIYLVERTTKYPTFLHSINYQQINILIKQFLEKI